MEQEKIKSEELPAPRQEANTAPAGGTRKAKSSEYAHAIQNMYAVGLLLVILVLMQGFLALPLCSCSLRQLKSSNHRIF